MKVSVIIPVYNSYKHMERCLKSLEVQTFKDFETIFIDDCSNDDTYENLKKYLQTSSLNYKILSNIKNVGPGVSRNKGIREAQGQYLSFIDSDDWYEESYLEKMLKCSFENSADIVMCNYNKVYSENIKKEINRTDIFENKDKIDKNEFLAKSTDSLCCMLFKRNLFRHVEILDLYNCEDVLTIPQLIMQGKNFSCIEDYIYNYSFRCGSLSNRENSNKGIETEFINAYWRLQTNCDPIFKAEIEFIGIKTILYGLIYNYFKEGVSDKEIEGILKLFEEDGHSWLDNKYMNDLEFLRKLFLKLLSKRRYFLCRVMVKARILLIKAKVL